MSPVISRRRRKMMIAVNNGGGDDLSGAYLFLPDGEAKQVPEIV